MRQAERALIYTAVAGMELSWLYILLSLLEGLSGASLPVYSLFPVYGVSFLVNRLISRARLHRRIITLLNILFAVISAQVLLGILSSSGTGLASWLLAVPRSLAQSGGRISPEVAIFAGGVVLWWLGYRLSRLGIDFALAIAEFQFGIAFMLFLLFIATQIDLAMPSAIPVVVAFFAFALLGVSVAHGASGVSWLRSRMRGYWMGLLILTIIVIVALSFLIASFVTPAFLRTLLAPVRWLLSTVDRIGTAVADFLLRHMKFPEPPPDFVNETPQPSGEEPQMWEIFGIPVSLRNILRVIVGAFWMVMIALGIWQFSRWVMAELRKRLAFSGAEVEHIDGAFRADVFGFIRKLLLGLLNFKPFFWRKKKLTGVLEIDSVRGIYRELLTWAKKKGLSRLYFQTPFEYLYTLSGVIPEAEGELRFITERYMSSRYGALLPAEGDLDQLKISWQRVKKIPIKKKSERLSEHRIEG